MIAILAAAVVPTVVGQLQKGDVGRMASDIFALRGAVEQFVSDVRKYPASIGQLTAPITSSMTLLKSASIYSGPDVVHWKGPYLNKDSVAAGVTAYADVIPDLFDTVTLLPTTNTPPGVGNGGTKYMVIDVVGVDTNTAVLLDRLYDDGNTGTGFIRWINAGRDTLKLLAMPLQ